MFIVAPSIAVKRPVDSACLSIRWHAACVYLFGPMRFSAKQCLHLFYEALAITPRFTLIYIVDYVYVWSYFRLACLFGSLLSAGLLDLHIGEAG